MVMGRRRNHVYTYFKIYPNKTSQCLLCDVMKKTSHGSNLLRHLQVQHKEEYLEVKEKNEHYKKINVDGEAECLWIDKIEDESGDEAQQADSDSNDSDTNDVSGNFIVLGRGRARCTICQSTIRNRPGSKKAHVMNCGSMNHSDNLKVEEVNINDDDTAFSEVVYLDEPLLNSTPNKRLKVHHRRKSTIQIKQEPKQQFHRSQSPQQEKLTKHEEECEKFGAYIIHLLKSTPPDVCSKLQMDIVALIMSEKIKMADSQKAAPTTPLQKCVDTNRNGRDGTEMSNLQEFTIEATDQSDALH